MVPDALCEEYLRCWIHRPAKNDYAFLFIYWVKREGGAMRHPLLTYYIVCYFVAPQEQLYPVSLFSYTAS